MLFDLGLGDGRVHCAVEFGDDLRRRSARRCDRLPGRPVEAWDADFGERRDVRRGGGALRRRHAERAHLARLDQRISRSEIAEHQLNMAGDDVIECGQGSLVRHMGHRDVERGFEQLAHEVMEGAGAARTVAQRLRLRELDEIGDGVDRQRRVDHEHEGHVANERDENEILSRIIGQLLVERRIHRHGPAGRHHDGVAIGRALRDLDRGCHRAGAGAVLDHERLAEAVGELLADQSPEDVGAAAGGERHDEIDLMAGIIRSRRLRPCPISRNPDRCKRDEQQPRDLHGRSFHCRRATCASRVTEDGSASKRPRGRRRPPPQGSASLTSPGRIHRFRALSPRAEVKPADRPWRLEATGRQRNAPSGAVGVW